MTMSRRRLSLIWMSWLAVSLVGCKGFFAPRGIPDDPLLRRTQPVESKGQVTPMRPISHREPMPPS